MSQGGANAESAPSPGQHAAARLLGSVQRAVEATVLYSPGHPAVHKAVHAAETHLRDVFAQLDSVTLGVTRDHFLWDTTPLGAPGEFAPLARALHAAEAAALHLQADAGRQDIEALVDAIARARAGRTTGPELVAGVERATAGRARVIPLAYDALTLAEGPGAGGRTGALRISWAALVRSLVLTDAADPGSLARSARAELDRQGGQVAADLRRELEAADDLTPSLPLGDRVRALRRMNAFLNDLGPGLRSALSAAPSARSRSAAELLLNLGDVVDLNHVLEAVHVADGQPRAPRQEVQLLFHMLARENAESGPVRERLAEIERRWHTADSQKAQPPLDLPLREILEKRYTGEISPAAYLAQLEVLEHTDAAAQPAAPRPPLSRDEERLHAIEIGGWIAAHDTEAARRCPGLFELIARSEGALIESGRLDIVVAAAEAARACVDTDPAAGSARALLDAFGGDAIVERLARGARAGGRRATDALALLNLAGPVVLPPLARYAAANPADDLAPALRSLGERATDAQLQATAAHVDPHDARSMGVLFTVLRTHPPDRAARVLEPLLRHADPRVRHRAFRVVGRLGPAWPEAAVRLGLEDPSQDIQALTVDRLGSRADPESLDMLAAVLGSARNWAASRTPTFDAAARALIGRGQDGAARVAGVLRGLARGVGPRRARYAARLAAALQNHGGTAEVDRAMRRWRRSLSRWVAVLGRLSRPRGRP